MKLRVLIVDDEELSRDRIRRFVNSEPETEVIAECGSGSEAVNAIRRHAPDVVFLDVRMPDLDGFGVLAEFQGRLKPAVVFVTAHDEFALRAFEIEAVDYLLKPFDRVRFRKALGRVRERLQRGNNRQPQRESPNAPNESQTPTEYLPIRSSGRITLLRVSEIDWISAADNYAELHVGAATHLLRITLSALAHRLVGSRFVRISRSVLVNLDRVSEVRPKSHGDYLIQLRNGRSLHGSRKYRQSLMHLTAEPRKGR
jgi:two-component system LytT family response regulator